MKHKKNVSILFKHAPLVVFGAPITIAVFNVLLTLIGIKMLILAFHVPMDLPSIWLPTNVKVQVEQMVQVKMAVLQLLHSGMADNVWLAFCQNIGTMILLLVNLAIVLPIMT